MWVSHDHLKCPMPEQFCNRSQIHPGHIKSTGKGMAVAMPGIFLNLGLFEGDREPSARFLKGITLARGRENGVGSRPGLLAPRHLERAQGNRIQRNSAQIAVRGPNQMELLVFTFGGPARRPMPRKLPHPLRLKTRPRREAFRAAPMTAIVSLKWNKSELQKVNSGPEHWAPRLAGQRQPVSSRPTSSTTQSCSQAVHSGQWR